MAGTRGSVSVNWKARVRKLGGWEQAPPVPVGLDTLERDWRFRPSRADPKTLLARRHWRHWGAAPATKTIRPITPHAQWIAYFIYLPAGGLTAAHRFTLERLRAASNAGLVVICATPDPVDIPAELAGMAGALYWKALGGFDFSAYALAIRETARRSPGADLLVLNDSVFGPFVPVDELWSQMRWDLSGFTVSGQVQNHLQSYAFCLRNVDDRTLTALVDIFPEGRAFDDYRAVVLWQETRFATVASRAMSVGALWYGDVRRCLDPTLFAALPLVEAGFPFLKRGLLGKHAGIYPEEAIRAVLAEQGHPAP
jgi:hypothetical protein